MGVFAPLVGIIGATQAGEALKIVAGVGETIAGPAVAARRAGDALARSARPRDPIAPFAEDDHDATAFSFVTPCRGCC
jgi:molybdopterin/thiamine biosynthesis adenylyltransferase